jgi:uncharacterized protein YdhG (YjbR/CyaY superfamily)
MSRHEVDDYLANVSEPQHSTLEAVRATIREILPAAEESISYGVPTFTVDGEAVAGFAALKNHCSYFPFSGSVLGAVPEAVEDFSCSRGTLRFATDQPLPEPLIRLLIETRLAQLADRLETPE